MTNRETTIRRMLMLNQLAAEHRGSDAHRRALLLINHAVIRYQAAGLREKVKQGVNR